MDITNKTIKTRPGKHGGNRKMVPAPMKNVEVPSALERAIKEERPPEVAELLDEAKILVGINLRSLRGAPDIYKSAQAISQLVRSISQVAQVEKFDELSDEALKRMSNDEIIKRVNDEIEKIKKI